MAAAREKKQNYSLFKNRFENRFEVLRSGIGGKDDKIVALFWAFAALPPPHPLIIQVLDVIRRE